MEIGDKGIKASTGDMPGVFKRIGRCQGGGHDPRMGGD